MSSQATLMAVMCLVGSVDAGFLRRGPAPAEFHHSLSELQTDLLQEIQSALGGSRRLSRVSQLEDSLRTMYAVLDKNDHGYLGHSAVRYALHRFFVQRHGWFLKGLEPGDGSWNESAPADVLEDRVPSFIQDLFEHRLGSRGLDLRELAILAATLEHLAHDETVARLEAVYQARRMPLQEPSKDTEVAQAIDAYMMVYILGEDFQTLDLQHVKEMIHEMYPTWSDTEEFLSDVRKNVEYAERNQRNPFLQGVSTFNDAVHVVEEVGERYGRFQDTECTAMKDVLLTMEDRGSGRVRLSNFYNKAVGGLWQFTESVAALRDVGALDESDPSNVRVIIPNYIGSPSNCLASASFYTTCCMDECEPILGQIERQIGAPRATPMEVISVVSDIDSPTIDAPRNLSATLTKRLEEVANAHDGRVPLHGRLFAQWLHHAFPRECPYPQAPGSHSARSRMDWMDDHDIQVTEEQMMLHAQNATNISASADDELMMHMASEEVGYLPWSDEELLIVQSKRLLMPGHGRSGSTMWAVVRCIALLAALASVGLGLMRTAVPMLSAVSSDFAPKEHVV